jgi:hypothetical protein
MNLNIKKLILVPAVITFGITILRLVGELNDWAPTLFSLFLHPDGREH